MRHTLMLNLDERHASQLDVLCKHFKLAADDTVRLAIRLAYAGRHKADVLVPEYKPRSPSRDDGPVLEDFSMNTIFKECEAWDEARKEHSAQIIDFLDDQMDGDLRQCLSVAWAQYEITGSTLWLAVCEGLKTLIRQEVTHPSPQLHSFLIGDEDVPF